MRLLQRGEAGERGGRKARVKKKAQKTSPLPSVATETKGTPCDRRTGRVTGLALPTRDRRTKPLVEVQPE